MTADVQGNAEILDNDLHELDSDKKLSKIEQKRQQILAERIQRKMGLGMTADQAVAAIKREDYENLPAGDKIKRIESAMISNIKKIAGDIRTLNDNQNQLADIMDVNFRAFERMLTKLGIPLQEQLDTMTAVVEEIKVERDARAAKQEAAKEEAKKEDIVASVDQAGEAAAIPEGATVFGN